MMGNKDFIHIAGIFCLGMIIGIILTLFLTIPRDEQGLCNHFPENKIKGVKELCKDTNIIEIYFDKDKISEQYYYEGDIFPTQQYQVFGEVHTITLYSHYEDTCDEIISHNK